MQQASSGELGPEASLEIGRAYLRKCGTPNWLVLKATLETRLYHDLGIYGDVAEECIEVLVDDYGVDISGFDFWNYFPQEFPGATMWEAFWTNALPWVRAKHHVQSDYAPIRLEHVVDVILSKTWAPPTGGPRD